MYETNLSAQEKEAEARTRLSGANGHKRRTESFGAPPKKGKDCSKRLN